MGNILEDIMELKAPENVVPSFDTMVIKHLNDYLYSCIDQLTGFSALCIASNIRKTITLKNDEIGHSIHVHCYHYSDLRNSFSVYGHPELFTELLNKIYICENMPEWVYDGAFRYLFSCMKPSDNTFEYLSSTDIGIIAIRENNKSYDIVRPGDNLSDSDAQYKIANLRGPKISKSLAVSVVSNGLKVVRSEYFSESNRNNWSLVNNDS